MRMPYLVHSGRVARCDAAVQETAPLFSDSTSIYFIYLFIYLFIHLLILLFTMVNFLFHGNFYLLTYLPNDSNGRLLGLRTYVKVPLENLKRYPVPESHS